MYWLGGTFGKYGQFPGMYNVTEEPKESRSRLVIRLSDSSEDSDIFANRSTGSGNMWVLQREKPRTPRRITRMPGRNLLSGQLLVIPYGGVCMDCLGSDPG